MENKLNETLIDLSVDIYQKCPTLPNHPPMVLSDYQTHKTIREAEGVKFSCASMYMSMGEHTGTHVDAFNHFDPNPKAQSIDQMPLENFYTDGICLDLSHKPLKSDISIEDQYAHTNYFSGGNIWTNHWFTWSATANETGEKLQIRAHFDYKWEDGKIVIAQAFFSDRDYSRIMEAAMPVE